MGNSKRKTKRLINEKRLKLDKKNEKKNQKIELNLLALGDIVKKICKDNKCHDRKKTF